MGYYLNLDLFLHDVFVQYALFFDIIKGKRTMLRYRIDLQEALKNKGFSTYRLQKDGIIGSQAIQDIRHGKMIGIKTIDVICRLLDCQISDFIEYIPDKPD